MVTRLKGDRGIVSSPLCWPPIQTFSCAPAAQHAAALPSLHPGLRCRLLFGRLYSSWAEIRRGVRSVPLFSQYLWLRASRFLTKLLGQRENPRPPGELTGQSRAAAGSASKPAPSFAEMSLAAVASPDSSQGPGRTPGLGSFSPSRVLTGSRRHCLPAF